MSSKVSQDMSTWRLMFRLHDDGPCLRTIPLWAAKMFSRDMELRPSQPPGMATHPETGEIWAIEHGPRGDELNLVKKGLNYGWPAITYGINYNGTPITDKTEMPGMGNPAILGAISCARNSDLLRNQFLSWKNNFIIANLRKKLIRLALDSNNNVIEEDLLKI